MNYMVLGLVLLLGVMGQLAIGLTLPVLSQVEFFFNIPINSVQLIISVLLLGLSIAYMLSPIISDTYGRRVPLLSGLFIGLIGSLLCLWSSNFTCLLLAVFFQGLGVGSSDAIAKVLFRDLYKGVNLATNVSYLISVYMFILVLSPVIGSFIAYRLSYKGIYIIFAFIVIFSWWLSMRYLPETLAKEERKPFFYAFSSSFKKAFFSSHFWAYPVVSGLGYGGLIAWLSEAPVLLVKYLLFSPMQMSLIIFGLGAIFIIGSLVNSQLLKYYALNRLLRFGLWSMFFASVMMFVGYVFLGLHLWALILPMGCFLLAISFVFSNAYAIALSKTPERFGFSSAIFHSIQVICGLVSSLAIIIGQQESQLALSGVLVVNSTTALMVHLLMVRDIGHEKESS